MGGSTSRSARDPSGNLTRRTIVSPAGRGTPEVRALACGLGASPRPTLSRQHVHAPGPVVAERTWAGGTGTTTHRHRDHLGSLRIAPDAAGALADAHDYYPFGGEMGPVGASSRRKFTGHERDEETGLDYMLARYYPASLGRFLSVDPGLDVQPENPQSWNFYSYVRNSPVDWTDPSGKTVRVGGSDEYTAMVAAAGDGGKYLRLEETKHSFLGLFHWSTYTVGATNSSALAASGNVGKALSEWIGSTMTLSLEFGSVSRGGGSYTDVSSSGATIAMNPPKVSGAKIANVIMDVTRALKHEIGHSLYALHPGLLKSSARGDYGHIDKQFYPPAYYPLVDQECFPIWFENSVSPKSEQRDGYENPGEYSGHQADPLPAW